MPKVECFLIVPTTHVVHQLRRYSRGWSKEESACPSGYGVYHNAMSVPLAILDIPIPTGGSSEPAAPEVGSAHPFWPTKCDHCDYEFKENDHWQSWTERQWRRADDELCTTMLCSIRKPPAGAIWDCWWLGAHYQGPDGLHLCVMTPGGEWTIDGPSKNGSGWTRTGELPKITVRPSILIYQHDGVTQRYHGFLTDGFLEDC